MVVPFGDPEYAGLRPGIAIPQPDGTLHSAIDLDGFYGFHPSLAPLVPAFNAGELAIMPAVHLPAASRSHFRAQDIIESGTGEYMPDGWLNRYLGSLGAHHSLLGVSFGNSLSHALRGEIPVSVIKQLGTSMGLPIEYERSLLNNLENAFLQQVSQHDSNRRGVQQAGLALLDTFETLENLDPATYQPQYGAVYPDSLFGREMAQTAQLIKAGLGTEIITVDIGGWDTHSNQGGIEGLHAQLLADFAGGLAAFHADMSDFRNSVMVLTMTEFGRTVHENASLGTDHGLASAWFAMGSVNGGFHGDWPGLSKDLLVRERFLNHSVDYRNVLGEVLTRHLGSSNLPDVLPGHDYRPVGLL
jgi:uncharacterized protein (DUF1501 family)